MSKDIADHVLVCTFCKKDRHTVKKLIAGPGVYICGGVRRPLQPDSRGKRTRRAFPGWGALTTVQLLRTLKTAALSIGAADRTLRQHVSALRARGVSWSKIATALEISRQAAWERFSG